MLTVLVLTVIGTVRITETEGTLALDCNLASRVPVGVISFGPVEMLGPKLAGFVLAIPTTLTRSALAAASPTIGLALTFDLAGTGLATVTGAGLTAGLVTIGLGVGSKTRAVLPP